MLNKNSRILIVGQGITGTLLSFKLSERNIPHQVLDNAHKYAATHAAAGLINPITGRNYVKSWMIDDLLPVAKSTYANLSKKLNYNYTKEINILRALHTPAQENKWFSSTGRQGYSDYLVDSQNENAYKDLVNPATYYGEIAQSLQVDISKLVMDYKELLIDQDMYIEASFDYEALTISDHKVSYLNHEYDYVIFCEGYKGMENPYFPDLPIQPAKGESFTIEIKEAIPNKILRDEIFLAPITGQRIWTGGTYQNTYEDDKPSATFANEWNGKLHKLLKVDYKVLNHKAGIRPAVKGRKPLIGVSPMSDYLYMFNGMGTKATSLAPYWAEHLIEHMTTGIPLHSEVNLNRFISD